MSSQKKTKIDKDPDLYKDKYPSWQFRFLDIGGPFGYKKYNEIISFDFEKNNLDEFTLCNHESFISGLNSQHNKDNANLRKFFNKIKCTNFPRDLLLEVVSNLSNVFLLNKILPFLIKQEKRKWKMIEQDTHDGGKSSHHDVSVAYCSKVAKDRLSILPINGTDKLFSFRLTNKLRLYGLRQNEVFQIVFIDDIHGEKNSVYPTGSNSLDPNCKKK